MLQQQSSKDNSFHNLTQQEEQLSDQKQTYLSQSLPQQVQTLTEGEQTSINQPRLQNILEIYNEEMSPTSISVAYDTFLQKQIAIKKIFKDQMVNDLQRRQAERECRIHPLLKHESIIQVLNIQMMKVYQHYENEKEYVLELEFMNNANYFKEKIDDLVRSIGREEKMKSYINDILEGLSYIHSLGYVHCDLKLENLFCSKKEGQILRDVKIGDMGLVHEVDQPTGKIYIEQKCGTLSYIAPEVSNDSYADQKIDIWSLGIVLYKMSCGYKPTQFQGYKYGSGPIPFRKFDWRKRSNELKDIISVMLQMDPQSRPSCQELLNHPWFETE